MQLIREGNPGKRAKRDLVRGLVARAETPVEPRWGDVLPSVPGDQKQQARVKRLRGWAAEAWAEVVPGLDAAGLLARADRQILIDHCVAWAMARESYREIAHLGVIAKTSSGLVRNPAVTVLAQQRDRLKHTTQHLGLSPLARDALKGGEGQDDDEFGDVFD
ncbi:phage terminase small subunit P27 family [Stomatohabitans albus]|uniref:phage terminase small subunit P27 family n=1 Tax=Stomatohabitans albus TaxID=3110766 RepID=UPI00300CBD9D